LSQNGYRKRRARSATAREDFSETNDLAAKLPEKLAALVKLWWEEAEKHKVLPLTTAFVNDSF